MTTTPAATVRAVVYARQSTDKKSEEDERTSVARQLADGKADVARRGWELVRPPFVDKGRSAYDPTVRREDYEALVDLVRRGGTDYVWVQHPDRLFREPLDRAKFLIVAKAAGLSGIASLKGVELIGEADDQFLGDLDVILAKRESATIARRMRNKHVHKAAAGEWPGGPPPFGFRLVAHDKPKLSELLPEPGEAAVVEEIARRLLSGQSARSVATDLNRRGLLNRGRPWRSGNMVKFMLKPALAGLRVHQGLVSEAAWAEHALISREDHERLVAMIGARRLGPRASTASRHALSGLLVCGRCGHPLTSSTHRQGQMVYRCSPQGGCGQTSISAGRTEVHVLGLVADHVDDPAFAREVQRAQQQKRGQAPAAEVAERLSQAREHRALLLDMLGRRELDEAGYRRAVQWADRDIAAAEAELARHSPTAAALGLVGRGSDIVALWDEWDVSEQRDVLTAVLASVAVMPSVPGGPRWQPERLVPEWRFPLPARRRRAAPQAG